MTNTTSRAIRSRADKVLDLAIKASLGIACVALVGVLCITLIEISSRYFFNSPTRWGSDSVRYLLAVVVMFGLPAVTRRSEHVSISIFSQRFPPSHIYQRIMLVICAIVCVVVAYIMQDVFWTQVERGVNTQGTWRIPKAYVTGCLAIGYFMSGLIFAYLSIFADNGSEE
ncbi:TRAP transporter small permease [Halomonas sp. HK25]|uniref:TRAP transporter small permease n=1 Tax=Halomonas sp. HK25 TaxID=3394321 RepID=UPI0039FB9A36